MMHHHFAPEFKKRIINLHIEEGHTLTSLSEEFKVSKTSISQWLVQYRNECQSIKVSENINGVRENLRLRKELEDLKKENDFLKKTIVFFAKEII